MLALHLAKLLATHALGLLAGGSGLQENASDGIGGGVVRGPRCGSETEGKQKSDDEGSHVVRLAELLRTNESFPNGEMVAGGGIEPPTQGFSVLCSTN